MATIYHKTAGKVFFFISLGVVTYFCFLLLNSYVLHLKFTAIGVFQELLTLPLLLFQLVLLVFSVINCINEKFRIKSYHFWSFLILISSNSYLLATLIIARIN